MDEEFGRRLLQALATVPDPRKARGKRHPLAALLAPPVLAMLCGARSLYAIAQWGRLQPPEVLYALGFTRDQSPAVSTFHEVFRALDVAAFEAVLRPWALLALGAPGPQAQAISIDGKGLRGLHGDAVPGVALVAAYAPQAGQVLAQAGGQGGAG